MFANEVQPGVGGLFCSEECCLLWASYTPLQLQRLMLALWYLRRAKSPLTWDQIHQLDTNTAFLVKVCVCMCVCLQFITEISLCQ